MNLTHELQYGTAKHQALVDEVMRRVTYAEQSLSGLRTRNRRDEELYYAYVNPTPKDEVRNPRNAKDLKDRPEYQTINIPYSYAIDLVYHTYLCSVFLSRDPILQYEGRSGETEVQEQAVEAILDYQVTSGGMRPYLMNWLADPQKFGAGVIGIHWDKEYATVGRVVEIPNMPLPGLDKLFGKKKQYIEQTITTYEGNRIYPVRLIDFGWDPRFPLADFQKGEFVYERTLLPTCKVQSGADEGIFIKNNVEKAKEFQSSVYKGKNRGNEQVRQEPDTGLYGQVQITKEDRPFVFDCIDMVWELVPKDWGLSPSKKPQKYVITLAEERVILRCAPLGCFHNKFPYAVLPMEVDYYKKYPRSLTEVMEPLENTLNWLLNQHFYNVRKHLNNQMVVDPSKVVLKDFYTRQPGGIIRMRPEAYGTDVSTVAKQLEVTDITRAHISDIRTIEEFIQRISGANDNVMGLVNPGGRKTAQEVRTSSSFATNRIKTHAEWLSATGFTTFANIMLQNTQQYMQEGQIVRIAGDLMTPDSMKYIKVEPEAIAGMYDFVPVDGTLPIDRQATANILRDMMLQGSKIPQILNGYNMPALFDYIGKLAGAKGLSRFRVQVVPDAAVPGLQAQGQVPLSPEGGLPPQPSQAPGNGNPNYGATGQ